MQALKNSAVNREELLFYAEDIIKSLGIGRTDGTAYDTAWVARLTKYYDEPKFHAALEWLRRNQHIDGTWGAPSFHAHDRYVSTLAAIITLRDVGQDARDQRRVIRGQKALWTILGKLGRDDQDTVGFPILSVALTDEALALGLDVPKPPTRFAKPYNKKIERLIQHSKRVWRKSTVAFSLEALMHIISEDDVVLEDNASVGISSAATAGYLLKFINDNAYKYLLDSLSDQGLAPALRPIDTFEIVWSLNHLRRAGMITPNDPSVRAVLDQLWSYWSQKNGIGYSSVYSVPDSDDTAAAYAILRWGGYPVNADVFAIFEAETYFKCYLEETDPSLSAQIRLLAALRAMPDDHEKKLPWIEKIVESLRMLDENGSFWTDKWHSSPYYVTGAALPGLHGVADDLAVSRFNWILHTQRDDGGWGYVDSSTPEETAYCMEALLWWDQNVSPVSDMVLDAGAQYLSEFVDSPQYTPLWIGKSLYTPHFPVKSAIVGSMYSYMERTSNGYSG